MRKLSLAIIMAAFAVSASAQEKITTGYGPSENWYGGVLVGGTYTPYFEAQRPVIGLELGKQISPIVGVSLQGITGINSTISHNAFDEFALTLNGKFNLMNLFAGYKGSPRVFEIEGIVGFGWLHEFFPQSMMDDNNMLTARFGGSLNFNVGKEKQWTISLRPAYAPRYDGQEFKQVRVEGRFEMMAGLTYHFKGKSGNRHFGVMEAYDQAYVDRLNEDINDMRKKADAAEAENGELQKKNDDLNTALRDCMEENKKANDKAFDVMMEPVVSFRQSRDVIDRNQLSNIENIANYMKANPDVKLDIKGYASPEGNADFNQKLSERRANAVKDMLVNDYQIEAERINAQGMGVGDKFSKPEMNRAIIATFYK